MVKGTILNGEGHEIGVTVNGVVAIVYGDQFAANHVPLQDGSNVITATATDINGAISTAALTVNAVTTRELYPDDSRCRIRPRGVFNDLENRRGIQYRQFVDKCIRTCSTGCHQDESRSVQHLQCSGRDVFLYGERNGTGWEHYQDTIILRRWIGHKWIHCLETNGKV